MFSLFFFFNDTATTEIYTLSLHDALPISGHVTWEGKPSLDTEWIQTSSWFFSGRRIGAMVSANGPGYRQLDRKSTRLNSSHRTISYAVFCLKKKKKNKQK